MFEGYARWWAVIGFSLGAAVACLVLWAAGIGVIVIVEAAQRRRSARLRAAMAPRLPRVPRNRFRGEETRPARPGARSWDNDPVDDDTTQPATPPCAPMQRRGEA